MSAQTVTMRTPRGEATEVKIEDVAAAQAAGYTVEAPSARVERLGEEAKAAQYDTLGGQILAGTAGLARGATLGLSDVAASALGTEGDVEALREVRKYNPGISLGAEIIGGVAPSLLTGGTGTLGAASRLTPTGALSTGAARLGETVGAGGGVARQIGGTALGAGAEGAIQNVGSYVSDVALENKQLSAEGFLASAGQGALWGGAAGGALGGIERGTIAARRLFPKSVARDREAVQVIEDRFLASADDAIKAGDDLEKVARASLDDLNIQRLELNLEREKIRTAGNMSPEQKVRLKEIDLERARIAAARKALRAERNAERAAAGLPDIPPEVAAPTPPPLDEASVVPTGPPIGPTATLGGVDDLEARLAATKGLLDQGVAFEDIGAAAQGRIDDLSIAAQNTAHEAGMLADDAAQGGADAAERLAQKTEDYAARKAAVKDWIAKYQPGARNRFSSSLTGEDIAGGAPRRTDRTRLLPDEGVDFEAQAGDRVFAGIGADRDAIPAAAAPQSTFSPAIDVPEKSIAEVDAVLSGMGVDKDARGLMDSFRTPEGTEIRFSTARDMSEGRTREVWLQGDIVVGGQKVGELKRQLSRRPNGELRAHHESIRLDKAHRGKGIADTINRSAIQSYMDMGVDRVTLAASEVGRYHWPKMGWKYDDPDEIADAFVRWVKKQPELAGRSPDEMRDLAMRAMEEPGGLANLDIDGMSFRTPLYEIDEELGQVAAGQGDFRAGKAFLLSSSSPTATTMSLRLDPNDKFFQYAAKKLGLGSPSAPSVPAGFDVAMPSDGMKLFSTDAPAVKQGVPTWAQAADYTDNVHVVTPSELLGVPLLGTTVHPDRVASVKRAWAEGKRLPVVEIDVTPSGRYSVQDGNHRLLAAAETNRPIAVRFKQARGEFAADYASDISQRMRDALPEGTAVPSIRRSGADLDSAYDDLIERASNAADRTELMAIAKEAGALEEEILERVASRGGADAEQVAKIRAKRAEYNWTADDVAARRAEKLAIARVNDPVTPSAKMRAEQADLDAYERAVRLGQGDPRLAHRYPSASERAAIRSEADAALEARLRREGKTELADAVSRRGSYPGEKAKTLGEEILSKGGESATAQPQGNPRDMGRFIADADEAIRVVGDFERAQYELAKELGPAAPPAIARHAEQYAAALDDQARKTTEAIAGKADDAVKNGNMPSAAALVSLPKAPLVAGQAKKEAGKLADVAGMLELLSSAGDIPFLPDWLKPSNLPVIGPMLSMYLKYRGIAAVGRRFGGRIAATTEAKVAARSAEIRDRAADIADVLLEGASKAAKKGRSPVVIGGSKLTDVLKHSLFPGGDRKEEKTAQDAAKARIEELSRAAADPDGVRAAVSEKVGAADPDLANAIADAALVKLQYLQKHAPKQPPPSMFGQRPWKLSTGEIERFARRVRAADDPLTVLQDVERGTVTAEAAETLREVYPALFSEVQTRLLSRAAELEAKLPYQRLVSLSLLFDAPLDDSLRPQNLALLQGAHASSAAQGPSPAAPGQPPPPSVAGPVNLARLYETPELRRAQRR